LHLLFQGPQSLLDVVVADKYLQMFSNRIAVALWSGDPDDFRVTRRIASMSVCAQEENGIQEP
jgi:hypothetical protein